MSSSSSWDEVRQRRTKAAYNLIGSSTPLEKVCNACIISASSIETNSSSSMIARRPLMQSVKAKKKLEPAKAKEEKKPAKAKEDKKPAKAKEDKKPAKAKKKKKPAEVKKKPAEKKTKAKINRKKTKPEKLANSDSDWLTTAELTDDEKENQEQSVRFPRKGLALFEDTASPELVRDAQAIREYHFNSPIRQPRKDPSSPIRIDLGDAEKSLPVEDLPHFRTLFESSDEEEELLLQRSDAVRTYPGVRDRRRKKAEISVDKSKRWLIDLKCPTTAADMLWDEYVKEHPEEMREYIAPPAERQRNVSSSSSNGYKGKATKKEDWRTKNMSIGQDDPNKYMYRVRGHYDINSKKWGRHYIVKDPYKFPGPTDAEFDNRPSGGSYLSWAGPSSSKNERIAKNNIKKTKIKEKEKLQKSKPVETATSKDFQRYSDLCSYTTRKHIVDQYESPGSKDAESEICSVGDSDLHQAGPSCSKNERITKKDVKNTKIKEKGKLQRIEPVDSASSEDFQDYSGLSLYVIRKRIVKSPYEIAGPKNAESEIFLAGDSDLHRAGPSCSKNKRITKKNVKNTKIEEKEKLQRSKPVNTVSSKEFQRYSDLCSYATRLKTKQQKMLSENVAESSNEKSLVSAKKFFKRKGASESNEDDSKRTKIMVKNAPIVRSVRNLNDKRYIKIKDHWRIV